LKKSELMKQLDEIPGDPEIMVSVEKGGRRGYFDYAYGIKQIKAILLHGKRCFVEQDMAVYEKGKKSANPEDAVAILCSH
jgi:hypothetical protein